VLQQWIATVQWAAAVQTVDWAYIMMSHHSDVHMSCETQGAFNQVSVPGAHVIAAHASSRSLQIEHIPTRSKHACTHP
jgi:hypothetical protein